MSNSTKTLKKFVLGLSFVALSATASLAQDYVFKVMASNGNVVQKNPAKRLWAGSQLQGNDQINVPEKGYVGLMHKNGRTIEIKQAGNYKISDLASKVGSTSSITSKYANYVAGEMSKADKVDINKNHRKYSSVTGSVKRAFIGSVLAYFPTAADNNDTAKESTASTTMYDGSEFVLHFYPNPEKKDNAGIKRFDTHFVAVLDMTNKEVARYETKEESIKIDLTKFNFKYERSWVLKVSKSAASVTNDFTEYHIGLLSKEDAHFKAVTADLKEIGEVETALDKLTQARVFEEHKLLQDAIRCHEQAIAMQPEVATFKVAYDEFLMRNRIRYVEKTGFSEDITKEETKVQEVVAEEMKKEEVKPATKSVVTPKKVKKGKK